MNTVYRDAAVRFKGCVARSRSAAWRLLSDELEIPPSESQGIFWGDLSIEVDNRLYRSRSDERRGTKADVRPARYVDP